MSDIDKRLRLLYAAVGQTTDTNLANYPATLATTPHSRFVYQNFRGGRSDDELELALRTLIENIASLFGHLRHWAKSGAKGVGHVDEAFNRSLDLRIIADLWNSHKHPGECRNGGYSKKGPRLTEINSMMSLTAKGGEDATTLRLGAGGMPVCNKPGAARVIVTATVLDDKGNPLGDINDIADRAIEVWEVLIEQLR
jgi:hypothetical protein